MAELSVIIEKAVSLAALFESSTNVTCRYHSADAYSMDYLGCLIPFCASLQNCTSGKCGCRSQHIYGAVEAVKFGGQYIFLCNAGLCHFVTPVLVNNSLEGMLLGGPVLMGDPDDVFSQLLSQYDFNIKHIRDLEKRFTAIPVISPERVKHLSDTLYLLSNCLRDTESESEQKELLEQQADISAYIHQMKKLDTGYNKITELEDNLFSKIEFGNETGAKDALNELLGAIYFKSGQEFDIIKARITELVVLLSRSAIHGGAEPDAIFGMSFQYLHEISSFRNIEQLSRWLTSAMNKYTEMVINSLSKNAGPLEPALSFIRANFHEKITLEETAAKAFLTPVYFSKLFKKNIGCNFCEYVSSLRVQMAKKLLLNNMLTVSEVAQLSGFSDQSYFSKTFKAAVGVSPKKYKNQKGKMQ